MVERLEEIALEAANVARSRAVQVVLAESCTAGLVATLLSRMPGASEWFCGSAVVYQNATKSAWLGISPEMLADPAIGPVSRETAEAMCRGVLAATPHATVAASVTGHLGPEAPAELDGVIYVGTGLRVGGAEPLLEVRRFELAAELPESSPFPTLRMYRQREAAALVLTALRERIEAVG